MIPINIIVFDKETFIPSNSYQFTTEKEFTTPRNIKLRGFLFESTEDPLNELYLRNILEIFEKDVDKIIETNQDKYISLAVNGVIYFPNLNIDILHDNPYNEEYMKQYFDNCISIFRETFLNINFEFLPQI